MASSNSLKPPGLVPQILLVWPWLLGQGLAVAMNWTVDLTHPLCPQLCLEHLPCHALIGHTNWHRYSQGMILPSLHLWPFSVQCCNLMSASLRQWKVKTSLFKFLSAMLIVLTQAEVILFMVKQLGELELWHYFLMFLLAGWLFFSESTELC